MNAFDNQCCEVDALMKALLYAINVCEIHTLFSAPPARTQVRTARAPTRQAPTAGPLTRSLGFQGPWLAALYCTSPAARLYSTVSQPCVLAALCTRSLVLYCTVLHPLPDRLMWWLASLDPKALGSHPCTYCIHPLPDRLMWYYYRRSGRLHCDQRDPTPSAP